MNKYQKALNALRKEYLNNDSKDCDTLQELVDKATPKKPIGKHTAYRCPVCGRRVRSGKGSSSFVKDNVCQKCYQVLDWSEEDE